VDPNNLDTLARVHYQRGEIEMAVTIQQQAIEIAPEAEVETYRKSLVKYKEALAEVESPAGTP
jgi:Ni,Fe-hydrogenase III large subunit